MLNISSQGVKNRILVLLRMGLLRRKRVYRKDSTMLVRFLTSDKGKAAIALHRKKQFNRNERNPMTHPIHDPTVQIINEAVQLMDDFLRDRIDLDDYRRKLLLFDVDSLLETYMEDFKKDARMIYYLDALMLLSSLQQRTRFSGGRVW